MDNYVEISYYQLDITPFSSFLFLLLIFFLGVFHASNILMQSWLRSVGTLWSMSRTRPMAFRKIVLHRRCNESSIDETFFGSLPKISSSFSSGSSLVYFYKYASTFIWYDLQLKIFYRLLIFSYFSYFLLLIIQKFFFI